MAQDGEAKGGVVNIHVMSALMAVEDLATLLHVISNKTDEQLDKKDNGMAAQSSSDTEFREIHRDLRGRDFPAGADIEGRRSVQASCCMSDVGLFFSVMFSRVENSTKTCSFLAARIHWLGVPSAEA